MVPGMTDDFAALLERGRTGDKRAVARLISHIEQGGEMARSVLTQLWPHTGRARIFGITGPPGAGKSTLTNALTKCWRAKGLRVGIIAVDPTSPFTGGAILGDRVRMGDLTLGCSSAPWAHGDSWAACRPPRRERSTHWTPAAMT